MSIQSMERYVIESIVGPDPEERERQYIEARIAARLARAAIVIGQLTDPEATRHRGESYSYARLIVSLRELGEIGAALDELTVERAELN